MIIENYLACAGVALLFAVLSLLKWGDFELDSNKNNAVDVVLDYVFIFLYSVMIAAAWPVLLALALGVCAVRLLHSLVKKT